MTLRLSSMTKPKGLERLKEYNKTKKHKLVAKKYREKNKLKLQEKNKIYKQEMREVAKDLGNCSLCFGHKESDKYLTCLKCRKYHREFYYNKKHDTI